MKVCVIGGGPAGLQTADFLLSRNVDVTLHEKDNEIGGLYKYSLLPASKMSSFAKTLENKQFMLELNSMVDKKKMQEMEKYFDAFVVATGAGEPKKLLIPGSEHIINGLELIKSWFESKDKYTLGKNVLVIGMGNVSMDIAKFLFSWSTPFFQFPKNSLKMVSNVSNVTICSRRDVYNSPFTNSELRSVLEIPNLSFCHEDGNCAYEREKKDSGILDLVFGRWISRKRDMRRISPVDQENSVRERRKRLMETIKTGFRKLRLLFNAEVKSITKDNDGYKVKLSVNGVIREEVFDSVISSIGFHTVRMDDFGLKPPVYYVGWSKCPKGNIEASKFDAYSVANKICEEGMG